MDLTPGHVLLHYRLVAKIGAGGMGEVWQATDTTLGREVAIKVLPVAFAADAERLARFEREARVLASLNHPGIAGIYGVHEADGVRFLALELVPGDDLAERLKGGPLALAEAQDIARQIACAVEAAHEQGVIHRDLKPANVKLTPDGKVKVLDFGLAKALENSATSGPGRSPATSPTITSLGTVAGVILGTAAYMSPEQARGKSVDKRADIWAFGCLFYEMLTARRPFDGETISDTLAAVLAREPDFAALPASLPGHLRDLLRRCLEKDPRKRLRDIGDARIELEEGAGLGRSWSPTHPAVAGEAPARSRPSTRVALAAALAVSLGALALAAWALTRPAPAATDARLTRLLIARPEGAGRIGPGHFAIAPNGSAVVFWLRTAAGQEGLWIRDLSDPTGHEIPGTDGASLPFWSADSRHIGFFAEGKLKRVPRSGGAAQTVCDAPAGRGGTWNGAGVIVFAPGPYTTLLKVDADGGVPEPATTFDAARGEESHRFPCFLPDGRHFIYMALPEVQQNLIQIAVAALEEPQGRPLLLSRFAARYLEPGRILFTRDQALVTQRINLATLTMAGKVTPLAEQAEVHGYIRGTPSADAAGDGTIVYDQVDRRPTDVVWLGRDGRPLETVMRHATPLSGVALSHDGTRFATVDSSGGSAVLWVMDVVRGTKVRLSRSDRQSVWPAWTADDRRIALRVFGGEGQEGLVTLDASSGAEQLELADGRWIVPTSATRDGTLVLNELVTGGLYDIVLMEPGHAGKTRPYLATAANETGGSVSPDGRFILYSSDMSGRQELYVDGFPEHREAIRVSTAGSSDTGWWREDGREIYFRSLDGEALLACDVRTSPALEVGRPRVLFDTPESISYIAPAPAGEKFLALQPVGARVSSLVVVHNWAAQLERQD